jgi:hypothetical protein
MKKCRWWVRSFAVAAVALLNVRATVLSMSGQVNMLGQLGGGLAVGLVGNRYGIRAALVLASMFLAPVLALYAGNGRHARHALTTPASS